MSVNILDLISAVLIQSAFCEFAITAVHCSTNDQGHVDFNSEAV